MAAVGVVFVETDEAVEAATAAGGLVYFVAVPRVPPHLDPKISVELGGYRVPRVEIVFLCRLQTHPIAPHQRLLLFLVLILISNGQSEI